MVVVVLYTVQYGQCVSAIDSWTCRALVDRVG